MTNAEIIEHFAAVARPLILKYFPARNSCIAATRTTIECLRRFGIRARAAPVALALEIPAYELAYISGLTEEQRNKSKAAAKGFVDRTGDPDKWPGHLVAVAEDRWFIDPTIDAAIYSLAAHAPLEAEDTIIVWDLGRMGHAFTVRAQVELHGGQRRRFNMHRRRSTISTFSRHGNSITCSRS